MWQKCVLLCVTLTRLERQPCLSSSSCVTSAQRLQSNLKGPGLPVSLPTHPHPRTPLIEHPAKPPHALSYQQTHIHAHCRPCILINVFTIISRQWPGWLAAWLLTKPRLSLPGPVDTRTATETNTGLQPLPVSSTYVTC